MSERHRHERQNSQDPVPSTSRGTILKHTRSQRNIKNRPSSSREVGNITDSDSSDIENDDINIPRHSKSALKKCSEKVSSRGKKPLTSDDLTSDDENVYTGYTKKHRVMVSDSDNDSDIQVKSKKGFKQKNNIFESEDSDSNDDDIIPKFRSKKCRLNFSDDSELTPDRNNTSNMGAHSSSTSGNPSRSASRQLFSEGNNGARTRARASRDRNSSARYFLDEEAQEATRRLSSDEWLTDPESEWDSNWENEREGHRRNGNTTNANEDNAGSAIEASVDKREKHLTNGSADSKVKEEKSPEAGNGGSNAESSKDSCPICLLDFTDQKLGTPASCDHVFCLECILQWCKVVNTCPADRKEFLSIHVRKHLGGDIVETVPVQDRSQNAESDDTACEVCGRTDGEDTMLMCDSCDLGYHMNCLNPPLTEIPADEWLCPDCSSGVLRGIGVNFLTLFSVFNEILGDRNIFHPDLLPHSPDLLHDSLIQEAVGIAAAFTPDSMFDTGRVPSPDPEEDVAPTRRRQRRNTRSPVTERVLRRRQHRRFPSNHRDSDERQTRSSARGRSSNSLDAESSTSATGLRRRNASLSGPSSSLASSQSNSNRQPSSRRPASRERSSTMRSPQGNQSVRERLHSRRVRGYTPTNFRISRSRTGSIRLIRRRWVDTSSSDE